MGLLVDMPFNISGIGHYLPKEIESSEDLSRKINKSEDWIISRTGVKNRHISSIDVDEMGSIAAKKAIGNKKEPDLIINASGVPKQTIPDTSSFIQKELGYTGIPSFSIHATCLSFLVALSTAASLLKSNSYKRILIVSADRGTRGRNYEQPESASLLGDAAASVYIESTHEDKGLINFNMQTFPEGSSLTEVRGGGTNLHPQDKETNIADNLFSMNGPKVYKMARKKVYNMIRSDLNKFNINANSIDCIIPHQASKMAIEAYSKYGGFEKSKVVNIIENTGNCVSASLPLALSMSYENNKVNNGDLLYLVGTGAGLSIASMIIKI